MFSTLDAFRGIAALWVVLCHSCLEVVSLRFPQLAHHPVYAFAILGELGVQVFFVISGFCIANAAMTSVRRATGTGAFAKARLRRLYPPYLATLLLTTTLSLVAAWLAAHRYLGDSNLARQDLLGRPPLWYVAQLSITQRELGQAPLLAVFWTLCYEVAFYVVVGVVMSVVRLTAEPARWLLPALHAVTLASMGLLAVAPRWRVFPFDLWPQFGLGVIVLDFVSNRRRPWAVSAVVAAEFALFLARFSYGGDAWHANSRVTFSAAVACALVLILIHPVDARLSRLAPVKLLAWTGTFSYSLYLTHLLPLSVVLQLARPRLTSPARLPAVVLIEMVVAVACAYPFFRLFERPFLSRRANTRVRAEAAAVAEPLLTPSAT